MTAKIYELTYRDKFKAYTGWITAADLPEAFAVGREWCRRNNKTYVIARDPVLADASILEGAPDGKQAPDKEK